MNALVNFIVPLAAIFFDLYMYIVLPGMATWGQVSSESELWFSFLNPFNDTVREFRMPSVVEDIVEILDKTGLSNAIPEMQDLNMFGLFIVVVGLSFFAMLAVKALRNVFLD